MTDHPRGSYAGLAATFLGAVGAFTVANRRRLPAEPRWSDVARVAVATHKLSRLVSREEVTSFLRAPVTADQEAMEPAGRGPRRALGELVTCPYCVGLWLAAGLSAAMLLRPRECRYVASIFVADAASDFLHAGFTRLQSSS